MACEGGDVKAIAREPGVPKPDPILVADHAHKALDIFRKPSFNPARPKATIAALDGALSEKDAAEPPLISARSVLSLLKSYWRAFQERYQRQRLQTTLHDLSDRELMDIGVTRAEIDYIAAYRAFDRLRDGTTDLWMRSRGAM